MKTLNLRYNPFSHNYEVFEYIPEIRTLRVLHEFKNQHDALDCKRRIEHHRRIFDVKRELEIV